MSTAAEMAAVLGAEGYVTLGELQVRVVVLDARMAYGAMQVLVSPVQGRGSTWFNAYRFQEDA